MRRSLRVLFGSVGCDDILGSMTGDSGVGIRVFEGKCFGKTLGKISVIKVFQSVRQSTYLKQTVHEIRTKLETQQNMMI